LYTGGTVDLTTYTITAVKPKLKFKELAVGVGGKCGSTAIDRQFHQWMSQKFGKDFDDMPFRLKGPGSRFMKEFELHKCSFGHKRDVLAVYEVQLVMKNVENSAYYDKENWFVRVTK
jgi:hypothetical protein